MVWLWDSLISIKIRIDISFNIKGIKNCTLIRPLLDERILATLYATDISYAVPKSMESSLQKPPKKEGWDFETGN